MSKRPSKRTAQRRLAALFERNGYVRKQNAERLAALGPQRYKKGSEVRLLAKSSTEVAQIHECLDVLDFTHGRPFATGNQTCIPIYGREQTSRFVALVGKHPTHNPSS